ncbi:MAG: single-stranded DNA-binding protein [Candidatus Aramenus sulfurataquae]|jgi:replication factor A1|uniref:Single-stranded DNA-binding protein n=2 Tax=Candidatus Aramenus sulfurataquae TaxID=1326980 RepID=W7KYJ4_9CREN|nr:MAG: single-stranded DNA-binding protein [Candidatus Aramenus sulfurataquae]MCL7344180.1 single-stranded DNA-binding protein [Candidatus Aramenus sulfurataquae]
MEEKIGNLKGGMENVNVTARVLEVGEQKTIQTKNGPRTIRELVVGDETGRVKLTLWGTKFDDVKQGQAIRVENGWTTVFRGQVQLNAGSKSTVSEVEDNSAPSEDQIPENMPTDNSFQPRRSFRGRGGGGRRFGRGPRRPREEDEGGEEE